MIADLTPPQRELADAMSEISEDRFYAGWMNGLEYWLWDVALHRVRQSGQATVSDEQAAQLRRLSRACGGWIVFDDETEETWVPLAEWEARFAAWKSSTKL